MAADATVPSNRLAGVRVLAALNGIELFGHERGNIEVFKTLRDCGAEVVVGTNAVTDNHVDAELRGLGFETFCLPFSNQWSLQWLRRYPSSIGEKISAVVGCSRVMAQQIRRFHPTHIHLGSALAYSYVSLALTDGRIPLIYRMGDCPPMESGFQSWLWRRLARRSNRIVAISNFVASRAQEARNATDAIPVIYNLAPTRTPGESTRTGANPAHQMNRIVYVGAIAEHKGLLPLIDAFACLAAEDATLTLDLVGGSRYDTQFREHLKSTLRDRGLLERVCFHGQMSDPTSLYECAAVHVAPSICEEAAGNVVLEAKTVGTPSVVFPSGGLPEMIQHGIDGYVCRERSVDALVEGIRWCLADPTRWGGLSAQARHDSETRFGPARFATAWAEIYQP